MRCLASDWRAQPHNRPHLAARRTGVPNFAGRRYTVPEGQKSLKKIIPTGQMPHARQASQTRKGVLGIKLAGSIGAAPNRLLCPTPHRRPNRQSGEEITRPKGRKIEIDHPNRQGTSHARTTIPHAKLTKPHTEQISNLRQEVILHA